MEEKNDEEIFNIKLNFYDELIDLKVNSDYNFYIKNICTILNVPSDKLKSFSFSYNDDDGDSILLSTEEDYAIFFQQVKEKTVDSLIIEVNENNNIDPIACFGSAMDYQDQIEQANNQIKNDNNNINNINNSNSAINVNLNNIENKYEQIDLDNNQIVNKEPENDVQIEDIIFEYKCTKCSTYPIICVMYYCPKCNLYLCESCNDTENHKDPLLKIESKKELQKIKEEENEEIHKKQLENIQGNMNYNNPDNQYNNNYPYYWNNNNINNNNPNQPPSIIVYPYQIYKLFRKPLKDLKKNKIKFIRKKSDKIVPPFLNPIRNFKLIRKARKTYNLQGISNQQLLEALNKTNGNIDEAIVQLMPK